MALCTTPPPLPVMVRVYVPGETDEIEVRLNVELKDGVPEGELNAPDTPAGAPERVRETVCGVPDNRLTLTE